MQSDFLKMVSDFAEYMDKEYIEKDDGRLALMICAADKDAPTGRTAAANICLGNSLVMTAGLASMMGSDDTREIFRIAREVADEVDDATEDADAVRHKLRIAYLLAGVLIFWTSCIIGLQAWGVSNWITTISNLLLMVLCAIRLWPVIRDLRRILRHIQEKQRQRLMKHINRGIKAIATALRNLTAPDGEDDDF